MNRDLQTSPEHTGGMTMNDPFVQALDMVVDHVRQNPESRQYLAACSSIVTFEAAMHGLAKVIQCKLDRQMLAHYLNLLTTVEPIYYYANPRIGKIKLADLNGPMKWLIIAAWQGSRIAAFFDTQPNYGRRFQWFHNILENHFHKPQPDINGLKPIAAVTRRFSIDDIRAMRQIFNSLGKETWRLFIDWEDQEYGPDVYDQQKHGRGAEPGYLAHMWDAHNHILDNIGQPLTAETYEVIHQHCVSHLASKYDRTYRKFEREYWRPKDWTETGFLNEIDSQHLRLYKHRLYEVLAVRYLKNWDEDSLKRESPLIAELLLRKYGHLRINPRILNREFYRFQVHYFNQPRTRSLVKSEIEKMLADFYETIVPLETEKRKLILDSTEVNAENSRNDQCLNLITDKQLLIIARLHKRLEYLRAFGDGNTRLNGLILNKNLVEFGFVPSILAQRNDAPFFTDRGWKKIICDGMRRWQAIRIFDSIGLLDNVLAFRMQ